MYHYTLCGLDNVWLENGYQVRETSYGQGISVHDVEGLHEVIALQCHYELQKTHSTRD